MKPKSRITTITVARLYNLGNYEHVRFEISAEVPKGGSPKQTLLDISAIAARLKPVKRPYGYDEAVAVLNKAPEQMTEYEKTHLDEYQEKVTQFSTAKALQKSAFEMLEAVGGTSKHTDAKDNWQDDNDCPW